MIYSHQRLFAAMAICIMLTAAACATAAEKPDTDKEGWIQLFDGKSLEGWTPKIVGYDLGDDPLKTFRVEDGLLTVSYDKYENFDGKFGHLFYKKSFNSYRLRIEYRFVGEQVAGGPGWAKRNSGAMIHGQPAKTMTKNQKFPNSIEVQFLGGLGSGERTTANLCTPGTHVVMDGKLVTRHCNSSKSKTYHGDQWVTVEIEVKGDHIRHLIDGEVVLEYSEPQLSDKNVKDKMLRGGSISLQSESHPIQFRKVEILPLED